MSLKPVLLDPNASVKSVALTQHPRAPLYSGGNPQALPKLVGYGSFAKRWNCHEWSGFQTGRVFCTEPCDERTDPRETVDLSSTLEGAAEIPALAIELRALFERATPGPDEWSAFLSEPVVAAGSAMFKRFFR